MTGEEEVIEMRARALDGLFLRLKSPRYMTRECWREPGATIFEEFQEKTRRLVDECSLESSE